MLQVTENGANITLSGKAQGGTDGLFWFGVALLIGAVGVAMAMSLLPERLAIGALAVLIVGSFLFNKMRHKQKIDNSHICSGILKVYSGGFVHNLLGKTQQVAVQPDNSISVTGTQLIICDDKGSVRYQISGFDSQKEAEVMQAILQGQSLSKRNANIKMQSS